MICAKILYSQMITTQLCTPVMIGNFVKFEQHKSIKNNACCVYSIGFAYKNLIFLLKLAHKQRHMYCIFKNVTFCVKKKFD